MPRGTLFARLLRPPVPIPSVAEIGVWPKRLNRFVKRKQRNRISLGGFATVWCRRKNSAFEPAYRLGRMGAIASRAARADVSARGPRFRGISWGFLRTFQRDPVAGEILARPFLSYRNEKIEVLDLRALRVRYLRCLAAPATFSEVT
jgi:hypothetical protein